MRTSEIPKQEEPPTNIKIAILKQDDKETSLPPLPPPVFSSPQKQQLSSAPTSLTPGEEMFYTPRNLSRINDQTNYGTSVIRSSVPIPRSVPPNPSTSIENIQISTNKDISAVTSSDAGVAARLWIGSPRHIQTTWHQHRMIRKRHHHPMLLPLHLLGN